ncbi:MAG: endolytic transglycosylase MltG [Bacteroidales bacterium]
MKNKKLVYFLIASGTMVIICITAACCMILAPNIRKTRSGTALLIPDGSSYESVMDSVKTQFFVRNIKVLNWVARKKNYPSHIKPGKYVFDNTLNYIKFINILRAGRQTPVKITFNNIRTINELAGKVGGRIEADSAEIVSFLSDQNNYKNDGFTGENVISVFIPDTYEFFWNTSSKGFYLRMLKEYRKFWNDQRVKKAGNENLTPVEVAILASIVDNEVAKSDEKPRIAGVYLNRLKRGMPLQSCPTIKFALNDYSITRVLKKYLEVDSPYNTYKHSGLPPGPISCPTVDGLEAVLNAEKNDYLYFAANPDFSGSNVFSRTLAEHNRNADLYHKELDRRKIFK